MPEGDTVWRAARALATALGGRRVTRFTGRSPRISPAGERVVAGSEVAAVESRGKHLLLTFRRRMDESVDERADGSAELVLHTHLGMDGSWRLHPPGTRATARARAVVETEAVVAACYAAPVVELLTPRQVALHPALRALGPDAMSDDFDREGALARLRRDGDRAVGAALLDQRAVAGVGNVLRCEALFLARVDPFATVASLDDASLGRVVDEARRLLLVNRRGRGRRTRFGLDPRQRLWVYGRAGRACFVCGGVIRGEAATTEDRRTDWCPVCQPPIGARVPWDGRSG